MSGIPGIRFDTSVVWKAADYNAAGPRTLVDKPSLGQFQRDPESGKSYELVKNNFGSDLVAGDVVFRDHANGVWSEVNQLGSGTTGIEQMAGVAIGAIPTTGYGWIQVWGDHDEINMEGTLAITVGDSLKGSAGNSYVIQDNDVGTEPSYRNHIVAREAYAVGAAALKKGTIRCQ